jgi:hypothetical protein
MTFSSINKPSLLKKPSVKQTVKAIVQEEKQVIIHCRYICTNPYGMNIRIWPSTYLIAKDVAHKSELVHAENIPFAPAWMVVPQGSSNQFSLIFTGLPKACQKFDLVEVIPQEGGFYISNIERNQMDIYTVEIT